MHQTKGFEVTGRCLCGSVVYRVTAPAKSVEHCHCSMCRRAHGALQASGAIVATDRFHLDNGVELLRSFTSSPGNHRWFCGECGCHIYMSVEHIPAEVYYWPASLDEGMFPGHPADKECHIFVGSKASWDRYDEQLTSYETVADAISLGTGVDQ